MPPLPPPKAALALVLSKVLPQHELVVESPRVLGDAHYRDRRGLARFEVAAIKGRRVRHDRTARKIRHLVVLVPLVRRPEHQSQMGNRRPRVRQLDHQLGCSSDHGLLGGAGAHRGSQVRAPSARAWQLGSECRPLGKNRTARSVLLRVVRPLQTRRSGSTRKRGLTPSPTE